MTKKSNISTKNSCFLIFGKRKVIIWSILLFSFCFILVAGDKKSAKASSAMISITTQNPKVQVGEEVYVIITIRSTDSIQGVEGYFSYDNRYLRYEKGGGFVHGNDDAFRVLDVERGIGATKVKYSVKFTARKAGSSTIQLKKPYAVIAADDTGSKMSVSYTPLNLLVEEKSQTENSEKKQQAESPEEKSQAENTEEKSKEKTQTASDETQSKSQKKKTDISKEEEGQTEKDSSSIGDAKISAVVSGGRICLQSSQEVVAVAAGEDTVIPEGFEPAQVEIGGQSVLAYALKANPDSGYVLIYGKDQKIFYLYDKMDNALYPYDKVKSWYQGLNDAELQELENAERKVKSYQYMLGIMATFCGLMVLLVVAFWMRSKKYS